MEEELSKIKKWVKNNCLGEEHDANKIIELTYKKVSEQWIKRLKLWAELKK